MSLNVFLSRVRFGLNIYNITLVCDKTNKKMVLLENFKKNITFILLKMSHLFFTKSK